MIYAKSPRGKIAVDVLRKIAKDLAFAQKQIFRVFIIQRHRFQHLDRRFAAIVMQAVNIRHLMFTAERLSP